MSGTDPAVGTAGKETSDDGCPHGAPGPVKGLEKPGEESHV